MESDSHPNIKEAIRLEATKLGFDACGFARADRVDPDAIDQYRLWLRNGKNDCMDYAARLCDLRDDPRALFPGTATVISLAMNYFPAVTQPAHIPQFAYYAYGSDYHEVLRHRLSALARFIALHYGATSRVCVDTAPVRERYWAQRAGIGFIGRSNLLIIPGSGSFFFLGELLTTLSVTPDEPCSASCGSCRLCEQHCPGGALSGGISADARRCLSCQLIERRGDLPAWVSAAMGNRVYGCDECQKVCPHNHRAVPSRIPEFAPSQQLLNLSRQQLSSLNHDAFLSIFRHSAVRRAKLAGLLRNAALLPTTKD